MGFFAIEKKCYKTTDYKICFHFDYFFETGVGLDPFGGMGPLR